MHTPSPTRNPERNHPDHTRYLRRVSLIIRYGTSHITVPCQSAKSTLSMKSQMLNRALFGPTRYNDVCATQQHQRPSTDRAHGSIASFVHSSLGCQPTRPHTHTNRCRNSHRYVVGSEVAAHRPAVSRRITSKLRSARSLRLRHCIRLLPRVLDEHRRVVQPRVPERTQQGCR